MEKEIINLIKTYLLNQKHEFKKLNILNYKYLIKEGVLIENKDSLALNNNSTRLNRVLLSFAEKKLEKSLPLDISNAFLFIEEFENKLKEENTGAKFFNSFSYIIDGLKAYTLYKLENEYNIDIKKLIFTLQKNDERPHHLISFEKFFLNFVPYSNYSEKEIFEICNELKNSKRRDNYIITFLRNLPKKDNDLGNRLLKYAQKEYIDTRYISDLLIGIYNAGDSSAIDQAINLNDKYESLFVLGRIQYKNEIDLEKVFGQIEYLEFDNIELANEQSYLIAKVIENRFTSKAILNNAFQLYIELLEKGNEEVINRVIQDIKFIEGHESTRYKLLHIYLSKTKKFTTIEDFFSRFKDPSYVFDIMMRLFSSNPDYRFSIDLFEIGIRQGWEINQEKTEELILHLFKQSHPFGILGVKVIFSAHLGVFHINLLKLDKANYQINAINSICNHPHSFDEILPLILPLRNSKLKGTREHLQQSLANKVFNSYHDTIFNLIKAKLDSSNNDCQFLIPIEESLNKYYELRELKASINDLNPHENEKELMDLYYRLEHERNTELMNESKGKGFLFTAKSTIIVRGNSFKFGNQPPSLLGKFESSTLLDRNSLLNPDLHDFNLNLKK